MNTPEIKGALKALINTHVYFVGRVECVSGRKAYMSVDGNLEWLQGDDYAVDFGTAVSPTGYINFCELDVESVQENRIVLKW